MTAKTPAQIAKIFGCTIEQARQQIEANAKDLRTSQKEAESKGSYRGFSADWYASRAESFESALRQE
jgi:hypothetical protein